MQPTVVFRRDRLKKFVAAALMTTVIAGCAFDDDDDNKTTQSGNEVAFTLQLLHVADMDGSNAVALANAGNFASNVAALRNQYPNNTLFLSSGDNYIPGSRYKAAADDSMTNVAGIGTPGVGRADIAMLNAMGVEASAVGNHDLDGGTEEFASIVAADNAYPGTQFPYLSSNMIFADDANTAPLVTADGQMASSVPNSLTSSVVIEVNGEKIGIVGATTPTNEVITSTGDITVLPADDSTTELAALIQEKVDALTATGINKVILLAHMQRIDIEEELATLLRDVDIIVAGGSNTRLSDSTDRLWAGDTSAGDYPLLYKSASGENVAVVNVDGDYKYLGRLVAGFDKDGELLTNTIDKNVSGVFISDSQMVTELGGTPNTAVDNIVSAINDVIVAAEKNIVGHTDVYLNGIKSEVRSEETNLGDLTADANLWYAKLADASVEISIKNGGGIRASIGYATYPPGSTDIADLQYLPPAAYPAAGKAEGDISQYDLQSTLAFNNSLSTLDVTAAELKDILEHTVADIDPTDASGYAGGRFPQISGMRFTFDPTRTARTSAGNDGQRITELAVDTNGDGTYDDTVVSGGTIQDDATRTFKVVTLGYLGTGGDGYPFPCTSSGDSCTNQTALSDSMGSNDPGLATFAETGSEQDALAEYLLATYPDQSKPFNTADNIADSSVTDTRIIRQN
ncbi:Trifunctional nucleotide phosphoesterase protein YfkN precursor [Vibrio aerogenes CECT 7868]|uniref:Trifunctional nucleotide phosphoesterase protein YfkN n=1 Tax=Vibrio aerogenes CECT 7868 TaxID=1216006 RepID=A0A1M5ZBZ6_9VIBR|nr:bifunctional metallophosphatase/5'-nucleotidase [Vibrio aerogenes]SHI21767.1 Trifunctional nucleotide phosphoesterase protein YfkN precursor [Vibrio aerogenes CECT 7868]